MMVKVPINSPTSFWGRLYTKFLYEERENCPFTRELL